jgi:hypothetical protein
MPELALAKQYPDLAADRAAYFVKIQEGVRARERATGWYRNLQPNHPLRPYYVLGDRLMAELAGLLRDAQLEKDLCAGLEETPRESVSDIEEMHRMLSPKFNDYADLPQWGIERYEAVISLFVKRHWEREDYHRDRRNLRQQEHRPGRRRRRGARKRAAFQEKGWHGMIHPKVQRVWRFHRDDDDCVGAIVEGVVPGLVDKVLPEPFVAGLSFGRMGTASIRTYPDGREFLVRPTIRNDETVGFTQRCHTIEHAVIWLEEQKQRLLSEGWTEVALDPVSDPD